MDFKNYRPQGILQKEDEKLISLIDDLHDLIVEESNNLAYTTLQLSEEKFQVLAHLLVEFFEDIHFDVGIWKAYEKFNETTFGTKLPCNDIEMSEVQDKDDFSSKRIQHFLWNIYELIEPNLILSPQHIDLIALSDAISSFISFSKHRFPKQSSIKLFLKFNNDDGYEVKKKLIWLGTKSYFFRENFYSYLKKNNYKEEIPIIDDFINQHSTKWSGMNVIDILPEIILIPQGRKEDIKSWYERHASYYLIKSIQGRKIHAENIVNKQNYRIIDGGKPDVFKTGNVVFGSTVKYGTDWYWSGEQRKFDSFTKEEIDEIHENFISKSSRIVYRYDKQMLGKAQNRNLELYNEFVEYFGFDYIEFKNGLDYASKIQKMDSLNYEKLTDEEFQKVKTKHNLVNKSPNYRFPEGLLNSENEIAAFYNITEGMEIISEFNFTKSALNKEGIDLSDEDMEYICSLIEDLSVSPAFIDKIFSFYGNKSVLKTYHLIEEKDINYLIHKYKGYYFKNRYPTLTLVDD